MAGIVAGVTAGFGPFCSKQFSLGVNSFLERLIAHLSWIPEVVEEVAITLKVLVALEASVEVVVEALGIKLLSFLIWVFLYCRKVFSLLLKMVFCRFVKVWSSSYYCRDVLLLAISVWRWLIVILTHLIPLWMRECLAYLIMACSELFLSI